MAKATKTSSASKAKTVSASKGASKSVSKKVAKPAAAATTKVSPKTESAAPTNSALKAADEGYQLARTNAVSYLHSRRQAMFALARRYHLDPEDMQQEAYEVLLTCLRDFNPNHTRADGSQVTVQFNTFFGNRMEGRGLEMRNRDPEYQARQAHMNDMSDEEKTRFRSDPPLLVQHLDQQTSMQEHLSSEVSSARRNQQGNLAMKVLRDSFVEKKLNQLIAQERDEKRRAALMHVKVGGISSFDEIAYHFGVTDSRASQILNELMDAFYVQRLMDGDLRSVEYDFRKLKFNPKRAQRLLEDALANATPTRAVELTKLFGAEYPGLQARLENQQSEHRAPAIGSQPAESVATNPGNFTDPFTAEENEKFPLRGLEWKAVAELYAVPVSFRSGPDTVEPHHISRIMERAPDTWPLIVTPQGAVIDGARRLAAAQARGKDKLLCLVRDIPTDMDAKILRVSLNMRQIRPDKMDLYWAICALADIGLSQQKIAAAIGTSRTNVIVYAKVKDKATPKLRALFEDGLIQITNASTCVDLSAEKQDELAEFIRAHGATWGKGPQFNDAYEATAAGKLAKLAAKVGPGKHAPEVGPATSAGALQTMSHMADNGLDMAVSSQITGAQGNLVTALRRRNEVLETALKDAETWGQQREATIARQTQDLVDVKSQLDALKREMESHELLKYGDKATTEQFMKEVRQFYAMVERLASAVYHTEKVARQIRGLPLTARQTVELNQQVEQLSTHLNALRVELVTKGRPNSAS